MDLGVSEVTLVVEYIFFGLGFLVPNEVVSENERIVVVIEGKWEERNCGWGREWNIKRVSLWASMV